MSTDRELLELAAKAAGLGELVFMSEPERYEVVLLPAGSDCNQWMPWNPLEDDGDALRLAVKLGFGVDVITGAGATVFFKGDHRVTEPSSDDIYASTRCAIVRAAAEIGRTMP